MANIQGYLARLEARLAPSLDGQTLQERLTEAEVHLRDRALEFEEIGLPPLEAEARAVAAFGDPEEYAIDLPAPTVAKPNVALVKTSRDLTLQLAVSILTLGVLAAIGANGIALGIAILIASVVLGVGALFGRPTPIRRLAAVSLALTGAIFVTLMIAYVPGYAPLVTINRSEIGTSDERLLPNIDRFHQFERVERLYREYGEVRADFAGRTIVEAGTDQKPFAGPTPDGGMEPYSSKLDAQRAWLMNGGEAHDTLLAAARADGLVFDVHAQPGDRAKPFAFDAVVLGLLFMALVSGLQAFGSAIRGGFLQLASSAKRTEDSRPSVGTWDRP